MGRGSSKCALLYLVSTLTEMREGLEELEQDAKRFRWCLCNPSAASVMFSRIPNEGHRQAIDSKRAVEKALVTLLDEARNG